MEKARKLRENRDFDILFSGSSKVDTGGTITGSKQAEQPSAAPTSGGTKKVLPARCAWCLGKGCRECNAMATRGVVQPPHRNGAAAAVKAKAKQGSERPKSKGLPAGAQQPKAAGQSPSAPSLQPKAKAPPAAKPRSSGTAQGSGMSKPSSQQRFADTTKGRPGGAPSAALTGRSPFASTSKPVSFAQEGRASTPKKQQQQGAVRTLGKHDRQDSFLVDDEEESDWRKHIRSITGYDPSKYRDTGDDRSMVADYRTVLAEERRSARLGALSCHHPRHLYPPSAMSLILAARTLPWHPPLLAFSLSLSRCFCMPCPISHDCLPGICICNCNWPPVLKSPLTAASLFSGREADRKAEEEEHRRIKEKARLKKELKAKKRPRVDDSD